MPSIATHTPQFVQLPENLEQSLHFPASVLAVKKQAQEAFLIKGLPSMKHEEWKYTFLQKYLKKGFHFGWAESNIPTIQTALSFETSAEKARIVLIDGHFSAEHSKVDGFDGLYISSLKEALSKDNVLATEIFGSLADTAAQSLTALHLALSSDGFFLHASANTTAKIELWMVHTGSTGLIHSPHCLLQVDEKAEIEILERHICEGNQIFQHTLSEIILEENARLNWIKLQDFSENAHVISTEYALVHEAAQLKSTAVSLNGTFIRNNHYIKVNGKNADADLKGVYILDEQQQVDNIIVIQHSLPDSTSHQLYKGILDGHSTGVFNGKIIVDQDAQKTNAFQSNKNILVSDNAAAYFRPQLEIFADDVKCSHGATSSEIEESELFYLRTRGIHKDMAKSLIMLAYAADVVSSVEDEEISSYIIDKIKNKLKLDI